MNNDKLKDNLSALLYSLCDKGGIAFKDFLFTTQTVSSLKYTDHGTSGRQSFPQSSFDGVPSSLLNDILKTV